MRVLRGILAVIVGFVAASVVMMIVEGLNGHVFFPELGAAAQGVTDREALRKLLAEAPTAALLVVLVGWTLGSFAGGFVATWIGQRPGYVLAIILGILLTLAGIANNLMLPPPVWFWVVSVFVFLPAAYAGGRLATKRAS